GEANRLLVETADEDPDDRFGKQRSAEAPLVEAPGRAPPDRFEYLEDGGHARAQALVAASEAPMSGWMVNTLSSRASSSTRRARWLTDTRARSFFCLRAACKPSIRLAMPDESI